MPRAKISTSFLRPPPDLVSNVSWGIRAGGKPVPGPSAKWWDYATPIDVAFRCFVDLSALLDSVSLGSLGLGRGSVLHLVLKWHSTNTGLRGAGEPQVVEEGPAEAQLQLGGDSLGGVLLLEAAIILSSASGGHGQLAPTRPGSILWSKSKSLNLEGEGTRFPVQLVSFESAGLRGPNAAWCLRWDSTDYDQAAGACLRVLLNRDHPKAEAAAQEPDDRENAGTMQVLRWDIARQMIAGALDDEAGFETLDWPEGSLGAALAARIRTVFPDLSLDECRALRRTGPEDFETSLQTTMGLFSK